MTAFRVDFKEEMDKGAPPTEAGDAEITAGLMEAIQNSIYKAIESMERAANHSTSNHYVTVVNSDSVAFKNELTGYLSLDPIPPVNEPSFISVIPTSVAEEPPSSESYSYEILTPVQIFWPDSVADATSYNLSMTATPAVEPGQTTDPTAMTYVVTDSDSSNSNLTEPVRSEGDLMVEDTSSQPAQLVLTTTEESSMDSIPPSSSSNNLNNGNSVKPSTNGTNTTATTNGSKQQPAEKIHKCEICDKIFSQAYRLRTHITTVHLGSKPFKCEVCSRAFARKSYLIQHGQVHAEFKRYQCDLCHTAYARLADFKKHCRKPSHVEKVKKLENNGDVKNESGSTSPTMMIIKEETEEGDLFVPDTNSDSME